MTAKVIDRSRFSRKNNLALCSTMGARVHFCSSFCDASRCGTIGRDRRAISGSTAMGKISEKLLKRMSRKWQLASGIRQAADLIQQALVRLSRLEMVRDSQGDLIDPLHCVYTAVQNVCSIFAERVSGNIEFKPYYDLIAAAEREYMPGGPPMSPLTRSYFTSWAFCDVRFGPDVETIGSCLLDAGAKLGFEPKIMEAIRCFSESRMGIYECLQSNGARCRLRELVTEQAFDCFVGTGYQGRREELWYARLCPPLEPAGYHLVFTTPYVLLNFSKADWTAYLKRSLDSSALPEHSRLANFLKYGHALNQWNEFLFEAYANYQFDAIFLTGLPDVPSSLPHALRI
jgi:hypothetical protein